MSSIESQPGCDRAGGRSQVLSQPGKRSWECGGEGSSGTRVSLCSLSDSEGQGNKRRNPYLVLSDVGALGVVRLGRMALMPYATTRFVLEKPHGRLTEEPYCNCARPRPLPAA